MLHGLAADGLWRLPAFLPLSARKRGDAVGMSYNIANNGGGGWVLHEPGREARAHAGLFHRTDPFIEDLRQATMAHGCVAPGMFSRDETPRASAIECELVVTDRATLAYRLNAVGVRQ